MAIVPEDNYPGKINAATSAYPLGSAKNVTVAGDGTGTPLRADWLNDDWGFKQALLEEADITPSGVPDTALASDYMNAILAIIAAQKPFIHTSTTINVPADHANLQLALEYLEGFNIVPGVTVTVNVAAGSYIHTASIMAHPQGNQIIVTGVDVADFPEESDYVITGNDSGARATDNANHLAMLQSKYDVDVKCNGFVPIDFRKGGVYPTFKSILFWSETPTDVGIYIYSGLMYMQKMAFHGFSLGVVLTNGGQLRGVSNNDEGLSITGSGGFGFQCSDESSIKYTQGVICCSNASTGAFLKRAGSGESYGIVSMGNGGHGITAENGGVIYEASHAVVRMNGGSGIKTALGGEIQADFAIVEDNDDFGLYADGGRIIAPNCMSIKGNLAGGVTAVADGFVNVESSLIDTNGVFGIKAQGCGRIKCTSATVIGNVSVGVWADIGGFVEGISCVSEGNGSYGFFADKGGRIIGDSGEAYGNSLTGVAAFNGGYISFYQGISGENGSPNANGILTQYWGRVDARLSTVVYNTGRGLYAVFGEIFAESSTVNNNGSSQVQVTEKGFIQIKSATITGTISGYHDTANSVVYAAITSTYYGYSGADVTATIASGAITWTNMYHVVDTEGAAASDDLDTITGGQEGDVVELHIANNTRQVTIKNGTGNIQCGADRLLSNVADLIKFRKINSSTWSMLGFADNA